MLNHEIQRDIIHDIFGHLKGDSNTRFEKILKKSKEKPTTKKLFSRKIQHKISTIQKVAILREEEHVQKTIKRLIKELQFSEKNNAELKRKNQLLLEQNFQMKQKISAKKNAKNKKTLNFGQKIQREKNHIREDCQISTGNTETNASKTRR